MNSQPRPQPFDEAEHRNGAAVSSGANVWSEDDWRYIYERYGPRLRGLVARRVGGDPVAIEDVIQETMLTAYLRQESLRDPNPATLWPWLARVADHKALHHAQRRQTVRRATAEHPPTDRDQRIGEADVAEQVPSSTDTEDEAINRDLVQQAMEALCPDQKRLVELSYYADQTPTEIARLLGMSLRAITARLEKARAAMRARLATPSQRRPKPEPVQPDWSWIGKADGRKSVTAIHHSVRPPADEFRQRIHGLGLTGAVLAGRARVAKSTVSQARNGRPIHPGSLRAIAQALTELESETRANGLVNRVRAEVQYHLDPEPREPRRAGLEAER